MMIKARACDFYRHLMMESVSDSDVMEFGVSDVIYR